MAADNSPRVRTWKICKKKNTVEISNGFRNPIGLVRTVTRGNSRAAVAVSSDGVTKRGTFARRKKGRDASRAISAYTTQAGTGWPRFFIVLASHPARPRTTSAAHTLIAPGTATSPPPGINDGLSVENNRHPPSAAFSPVFVSVISKCYSRRQRTRRNVSMHPNGTGNRVYTDYRPIFVVQYVYWKFIEFSERALRFSKRL